MELSKHSRNNEQSISMEAIIEVLDSHQAVMITKPDDELKFRELDVSICDVKYNIEWWINISYLHTPDGAILPFHDVAISGTWPNKAKLNVQFRYHNEACFIIPLEYYSED